MSIILPTYNEKQNVLCLIDEINAVLKDVIKEIIVVDDNSPDGTYEALVLLKKENVRPILRTTNRGLANSIRCGLETAQGEILIVMDSDFNHQPKYLPFMIDSLKHYECVTASRYLYGGKMDSRIRHLLSWLFNVFTRVMTGGYITDNLYGFFAIKRESLTQLDYNNIFWGYGDYFIRLLYYLQKQEVTILQFPAVNGKRLHGEGNSRFFKVFIQYSMEVVRLACKIKYQKYTSN